MKDGRFQFKKPADWHIIKPERYKDFSILSTESVPCLYGFAIERDSDGYDVVSMFDYGEFSELFISEFKEELDKLSADNSAVGSVNDYIEEKAEGFDVTHTTSMQPLLYRKVTIHEKRCFVNIMKIHTNVGVAYSLQIFVKVGDFMLCFGTSVRNIDESDPFTSVLERYPFVCELVHTLIPSIEPATD